MCVMLLQETNQSESGFLSGHGVIQYSAKPEVANGGEWLKTTFAANSRDVFNSIILINRQIKTISSLDKKS